MIDKHSDWICCQLGAREHYAIPRVLHQQGQLKALITDTWIDRHHPLNWLPKSYLSSLRARYHPQLDTATVKSFTASQIIWEIARKNKFTEWQLITARNLCWQERVLEILDRVPEKNITLFAYSYAALQLFKYAKARGWKTVLGQIDPGMVESQLVAKKERENYYLAVNNTQPSDRYWTDWQAECSLSDRILVNSRWSSQALQQAGIDKAKIFTVPLAYQSENSNTFIRTYPDRFTEPRPLKVLFLGQVIIRKGIAEILEAISLLLGLPIEFWFVGQVKVNLPESIINHPQIKWLGSVSRSNTDYYYQQADVFLFPTHSDGFGLTQLEAQAWKLPIIASHFCGSVVKEQINGLILRQVTGKEIAQALTFCLHNPQELTKFSHNSTQILSDFTLDKLGQKITAIHIT